MLLLVLFAGCLASCAAQTTSFSTSTTTTLAPASPTPIMEGTSVQPVPNLDTVAILEAAVLSHLELNETTLPAVLTEVEALLQTYRPEAVFSLSVKKITQV